jgi:vancomycin aglycone glucosyltransferase
MRVLLSTYGSQGDVEPMLGLAGQLRALGAQVRLCAPPNFAERVAEVGVELHPAELFAGQFDAVSTVTEAAAGCDALVATGMIPATGRPYPPERTDAQSINALFREVLNTHRASIGMAPVDGVHDYVRDDVIGKRPWLATDPVLDPWQATPDLPRPPLGGGSRLADLTLTRDDDCIGVGEVNQQALFARVATVVHHGGAGTTTTAARADAPQVVVPQAADQPYWAGRVAELGIGAAYDGPTPTIEWLSDALEKTLSAETRASERRCHDPRRRGEGRRKTCT